MSDGYNTGGQAEKVRRLLASRPTPSGAPSDATPAGDVIHAHAAMLSDHEARISALEGNNGSESA